MRNFTTEELDIISQIEKMTIPEQIKTHKFYCLGVYNRQAQLWRFLIERQWEIQNANYNYFVSVKQ